MWISLFVVMFVIFMVCVAFTWNEGAWNNILTYFMALFAAIMATNYYAAIGVYLTFVTTIYIPFVGELREYTGAANYLWDIISFWFIFGFTFSMLRLIVGRLSKFKVKFKKPIEIITNWLMSFTIGAFMVTIFLFTIHIAPLARHPFGGAFMFAPEVPGPSRVWMWSCTYWSSNFGSLSNLWRANTFGPADEFIEQHYWRRRTLEGEGGFTVDIDAEYSTNDNTPN